MTKTERLHNLLRVLILLTILLSPLYIIRWSYFGIPTTLLENLILTTLVVWGVTKFLKKDFTPHHKAPYIYRLLRMPACTSRLIRGAGFTWPRTSFDKPILFFVFAALVSLFATPDLRSGMGIFKAYIIEPILFFYLVVDTFSLCRNSPEHRELQNGLIETIPLALILSAFWVSWLGITQVFLNVGIFAPHEAVAGRAHAVYNSGNALGLYVGPIFSLTLGMFALKLKNKNLPRQQAGEKLKIEEKNSKLFEEIVRFFSSTSFILFSLFSFLLAIFLSRSTGASIGLTAATLVFVLLVGYRLVFGERLRKLFRLGFILGVPLGFITLVYFFLNISKFTPEIVNPWDRPTDDTLIPRLCLWEGAKNLLFDRPILGAGLSGFKELYSSKYYTCDAEPLEYPHNFFLNLWAEMGILGLVSMSFILFTFFHLLLKIYLKAEKRSVKEDKSWYLSMALIAAMTYWLVHGLVDVPYLKNDLALEFWIMMAMGVILQDFQLVSELPTPPRNLPRVNI